MATRLALLAVLAVGLAGCDRSDLARTDPEVERMKRFAYEEMEQLARRTCRAVPRDVLARSLAAVSSDPVRAPDSYDDNAIALLFVEDVSIQRIPFQRAAYDGCLDGLKAQRRRSGGS